MDERTGVTIVRSTEAATDPRVSFMAPVISAVNVNANVNVNVSRRRES
jgi:hypothetical protein